MARPIRWLIPLLLLVLLLGLVWFGYSANPTVTGLRHVVEYRIVEWTGGPRVRTGEPPGSISSTVQDAQGHPIAGAVVVVASPLGDAYAAETGPDGTCRLDGVPPGRYVPVAGRRGYADALPETCAAGLCFKHKAAVRAGRQAAAPALVLRPYNPPDIALDDSLVISPTFEVEVSAPLPGQALRTGFRFARAGLQVDDCWLYEPLEGTGPFPTMLLILPGPVMNWQIVPVPFAAEGFSVLACYPLRGTDIDGDAADLLTALEYLRQGRVPSRAGTEQLALVSASFTSLHAYRILEATDEFDVSLALGGFSDAFQFRHDVETGNATARPPFDQVLVALGFPNRAPELYFHYSVIYHLDGLPPLCLLHGREDELSPFSQSVELANALAQRGLPYEFHAYEGLSHYFSTSADSATTQQMFRDSLACLRRWLGTK